MRVTSRVALVVEPRSQLGSVYQVLAQHYQLIHSRTIPQAIALLHRETFSLTILSASFSAGKSLEFLEALKEASRRQLIPVVIMVDLSHRINVVPGTHWGEKLGILCSLSGPTEVASVLDRVSLA